ncbi:hypothetical protein [Thorsellia anophelis]|uniref:hypothetical protein n=1 Tax=Thorsellia anophelis TaxID=336804 RepID=UPI00115FF0E6|nr:hypothetical protein [Thorsellia anophelis]
MIVNYYTLQSGYSYLALIRLAVIVFISNAFFLIPQVIEQNKLIPYLKVFVTASLIALLGSSLFWHRILIESTSYINYVLLALGFLVINMILLPYGQLWVRNLNPFKNYTELAFIAWQNYIQIAVFKLSALFLIPIISLGLSVLIKDTETNITNIQIFLGVLILCIIILSTTVKNIIILKLLSFQFFTMRIILIISCAVLTLLLLTYLISPNLDYSDASVISWQLLTITILITAQASLNRITSDNNFANKTSLKLLFCSAVFCMALFSFIQIVLIFQSETFLFLDHAAIARLTLTVLTAIFTIPYAIIFLFSLLIKPNKLIDRYQNSQSHALNSFQAKNSNQNIMWLRQLVIIKKIEIVNIIGSLSIVIVLYLLMNPFYTLNSFIANYHVERLLTGKTEIKFFDYRLLTVELGKEGKEAYATILDKAKAAGYKDIDLLENKLNQNQYEGNEAIYERLEDELSLVEYYKNDIFKDIDVFPKDTVIDNKTMQALRQYIQEYFYLDFCQYHPKFPETPLESKCTIHKLTIDNQNPNRVIYAITNLTPKLKDRMLQKTIFVQINDKGVATALDSAELADCKQNKLEVVSDYEELNQYNKTLMEDFRTFDNPFYTLISYDSISMFNDVCETLEQ